MRPWMPPGESNSCRDGWQENPGECGPKSESIFYAPADRQPTILDPPTVVISLLPQFTLADDIVHLQSEIGKLAEHVQESVTIEINEFDPVAEGRIRLKLQ